MYAVHTVINGWCCRKHGLSYKYETMFATEYIYSAHIQLCMQIESLYFFVMQAVVVCWLFVRTLRLRRKEAFLNTKLFVGWCICFAGINNGIAMIHNLVECPKYTFQEDWWSWLNLFYPLLTPYFHGNLHCDDFITIVTPIVWFDHQIVVSCSIQTQINYQ